MIFLNKLEQADFITATINQLLSQKFLTSHEYVQLINTYIEALTNISTTLITTDDTPLETLINIRDDAANRITSGSKQ